MLSTPSLNGGSLVRVTVIAARWKDTSSSDLGRFHTFRSRSRYEAESRFTFLVFYWLVPWLSLSHQRTKGILVEDLHYVVIACMGVRLPKLDTDWFVDANASVTSYNWPESANLWFQIRQQRTLVRAETTSWGWTKDFGPKTKDRVFDPRNAVREVSHLSIWFGSNWKIGKSGLNNVGVKGS